MKKRYTGMQKLWTQEGKQTTFSCFWVILFKTNMHILHSYITFFMYFFSMKVKCYIRTDPMFDLFPSPVAAVWQSLVDAGLQMYTQISPVCKSFLCIAMKPPISFEQIAQWAPRELYMEVCHWSERELLVCIQVQRTGCSKTGNNMLKTEVPVC